MSEHTALQAAAREGEDLRARLTELEAKWSGCWCEVQMSHDHDPRVRDCPQHGDDSCRHMAEGITVDLRALLAAAPPPPDQAPTDHECGHRFQFLVRSSLHVSGPGEHTDADWWGTADGPVEVRAHNLRDALRAASALPLHVWFDHGRDEADDDEVTNAVWEEAVANGEPWATES